MPEPTPRVISWYGAKTGERSRPRNEPRKTKFYRQRRTESAALFQPYVYLEEFLIYDCFSPLGWEYDLLNLKQMYYGLQNVPVTNLLEDAYTRNDAIKGDKIYCDYFLENGNFLKLEELTFGI